MTDRIKDQRVSWWIRLWVRLTSKRATPQEIAATEVSDADIARLQRRIHERGHLTPMHAAACPLCRAERKDQ